MTRILFLLFNIIVFQCLGLSQSVPLNTWGDQGNGTYINPILNADYSDPDVIRVGDKYYMVASDFHFLGMQVLESEDMVNWKLLSQVYSRFDFPGWDTNEHYAGGSWAPAIRYHDGKFWIFFCTIDEGLFMTNATDPAGPWSPLVNVCHVAKWEDPCPFWDEDGQAYLGRSIHGAGPIIIHKMSPDGTKLLDEGRTVYTGPVAEGTKIHKRNGYYYLSIPEGGVEGGWQTVLRSKSIYGPYEKKVVLEQGSTDINGPHQGAIVDTPAGEWFFYHFQKCDPLGRVVHLQPMHWENNWPVIGVDIDGNGIGEPVRVWTKPRVGEEAVIQVPRTDDDFNSDKLGLQWQFNHNPDNAAWSLTERKGMLTLHALQSADFIHARNTLTQKTMGYIGTATVEMDFSDIAEGQRCGLACIGKENHLLGVKKEKRNVLLYLECNGKEAAVYPVSGNTVYLRLQADSRSNRYTLLYSMDNVSFEQAGDAFPMQFGHWKGVRVGLFCYNTQKASGKAAFNWFAYQHDGPEQAEALTPQEAIVRRIATTAYPNRIVSVQVPEKAETSLQVLQQAIDSCSWMGGGTVWVKAGLYPLNGTLHLKSDVNLHLEDEAYLQFSGRASDFLPVVLTRWEGTELYGHSPMIYAYHATNIAITGKGVIDAQGGKEFALWSQMEAKDRDRLREMGDKRTPVNERVFGEGTLLRPSCIQFLGCSRILVEGITVKDSPFWTIHPVYCDNVIVRGVTIDSHFPNNDGCDPESTSNVLIENCTFRTGDDAIAIKAGRDTDGRVIGRPSRNIVIRDCVFHSECNGLCIGSEMSGGVSDVYMERIEIGTVKNALYFKSNRDRGGYIRNVFVDDIRIERAKGAILRFETNYFGFRGGNHQALYEDFQIRHVQAGKADNYAVFMDGNEVYPIRNIDIQDFHVEDASHSYYLMNTEQVRFKYSTVNGQPIPEHPEESKERVTLEVY